MIKNGKIALFKPIGTSCNDQSWTGNNVKSKRAEHVQGRNNRHR